MSGGFFDYKQYNIVEIYEMMDEVLKRLDIPIPEKKDDELYSNSLKPYVEDIDAFKSVILTTQQHLKMANLYTRRIDWFLSGDDGEETFYKRIEEDKKNL